jgi:hypothetical protein
LVQRADGKREEDLVAGLILSGSLNGTSFNYSETKLPVLVRHYENDQRVGTTPGHARTVHARLKESGNASTDLVFITGGAPNGGNPCTSGFHMYQGAGSEVARVLDRFMSKHLDLGDVLLRRRASGLLGVRCPRRQRANGAPLVSRADERATAATSSIADHSFHGIAAARGKSEAQCMCAVPKPWRLKGTMRPVDTKEMRK